MRHGSDSLKIWQKCVCTCMHAHVYVCVHVHVCVCVCAKRGQRQIYQVPVEGEVTGATSHQRSSYALTLCRESSAPPLNETFESN